MDSIGVWQRSTADRLFFSCQSEHRHHIVITSSSCLANLKLNAFLKTKKVLLFNLFH